MEKLHWTVQVENDPAYSTDDTGRLYAYVTGLLVGGGVEPARAVMDANGAVTSAVTSGDGCLLWLPDKRAVRVQTYGRVPEWGILPSGDSIREGGA